MARDNRESHKRERRSQKITHTRQVITENLTQKASDHRESHAQGK